MIENDMQIGQIIRKIRKDREITMKQLAELTGVSEQAISQYELGKRKISSELIKLIAAALAVPPRLLLTDINDIVDIENKRPEDRTDEERELYSYFIAQATPQKKRGFDLHALMEQRPSVPSSGTNWIKEMSRPLFSVDELSLLSDYNSLNDEGKEYLRQTMKIALKTYKRAGGGDE